MPTVNISYRFYLLISPYLELKILITYSTISEKKLLKLRKVLNLRYTKNIHLKIWNSSWICLSSLLRFHANLLLIILLLVNVLSKLALIFLTINLSILVHLSLYVSTCMCHWIFDLFYFYLSDLPVLELHWMKSTEIIYIMFCVFSKSLEYFIYYYTSKIIKIKNKVIKINWK